MLPFLRWREVASGQADCVCSLSKESECISGVFHRHLSSLCGYGWGSCNCRPMVWCQSSSAPGRFSGSVVSYILKKCHALAPAPKGKRDTCLGILRALDCDKHSAFFVGTSASVLDHEGKILEAKEPVGHSSGAVLGLGRPLQGIIACTESEGPLNEVILQLRDAPHDSRGFPVNGGVLWSSWDEISWDVQDVHVERASEGWSSGGSVQVDRIAAVN